MTESAVKLHASDVTVSYGTSKASALKGVDLSLGTGEILGIVGESGSGKSTLGHALMGLLPGSARVSGTLDISGESYALNDVQSIKQLRKHELAMIFQEPTLSLDPRMRVGASMRLALPANVRRDRVASMARIHELFDAVGLEDLHNKIRSYPHELSGGIAQRVMIALALAKNPSVLIADEATTALDVSVQGQVLQLLARLRRELHLSILLISHDLNLVGAFCDRVIIMKDGAIVEEGSARSVLFSPKTPYGRTLVEASLSLHSRVEDAEVEPTTTRPVISAKGVTKVFKGRRGARRSADVTALDDVSLDIVQGESLGIVGESGSGKTTLARLLVGLDTPTSGAIERWSFGDEARTLGTGRDSRRGGDASYVFQAGLEALNPFYPVEWSVKEALRLSGADGGGENDERVRQVFEDVGLPYELATRRPRRLSGGQRQRAALARSLICRPKIVIADEPTSALDATIRKHVADSLRGLHRDYGFSLVVVSHDLPIIRYLCSRVAVMYLGKIVETGPTEEVFRNPRHEYTKSLLAAIPEARLGDTDARSQGG